LKIYPFELTLGKKITMRSPEENKRLYKILCEELKDKTDEELVEMYEELFEIHTELKEIYEKVCKYEELNEKTLKENEDDDATLEKC
jgi:hypothetical protein